MQSPSASDPSFAKFLEDLKKQNNQQFATQLLQLKSEREIAGEDNDKREEQLDSIDNELKNIKQNLVGFDISELIKSNENTAQILTKSLEELSLIRKITEGSLEYDKASAQYRNTSGREITSLVSGKEIKKGGYVDFETAADRLSGQGIRVRESERNQLKLAPVSIAAGNKTVQALGAPAVTTGARTIQGLSKPILPSMDDRLEKTRYQGFFEELKSGIKFFLTDGKSEEEGYGWFQKPPKDVIKKEREQKISSDRQKVESPENPESDNVVSATEAQADYSKQDLEITRQILDSTREQLSTLREIRDALAPKTPSELQDRTSKNNILGETASAALGGLPSLDIDLPRRPTPPGVPQRPGRTAPVPQKPGQPKPAGKVSRAAKLARFARFGALGGAGAALGAVGLIGGMMYLATKGKPVETVEESAAKQQEVLESGGSPEELSAAGVSREGLEQAQKVGGLAGVKDEQDRINKLPEVERNLAKLKDIEKTFNEGEPLSIKQLENQAMAKTEAGRQAIEIYKKEKGISTRAVEGKDVTNSTVVTNESFVMGKPSVDMSRISNSNITNVTTPSIPNASTGMNVARTSTENADMVREVSSRPGSVTPIISNNVTNTNTTKYVPVKAEPRTNSSSSLQRYLDRIAVY